jgi:hypothetical protein
MAEISISERAKLIWFQDVLYLMVVNMPSEAEIRQAVALGS